MKRIVLYCLACLLLSACIKEDTDDCGAEARFFVTHDHSVQEFDELIGNDVYFQVFQNERVLWTERVPYETIKGGREYVIRNYESGEYCIVAWAVPAGDTYVPAIPDADPGESYHDISLDLSRLAGSTTYYQPMGDIFLGEEEVTLNSKVSSRHEISLTICVAHVYFFLYGADLLTGSAGTQNPDVWIELDGTRSEMNIDRSCGGEDAAIYRALTYEATGQTLYSNKMGVLPSEEDQYLSVTVYVGNTKLLLVETFEQANPGDEIRIEATLNGGVEVYINGWRIKTAQITYF